MTLSTVTPVESPDPTEETDLPFEKVDPTMETDPSSIYDLKSKVIGLEKQSFAKDRNLRLTSKVLRENKNSLGKIMLSNESEINSLKAEKKRALVLNASQEKKMQELSEDKERLEYVLYDLEMDQEDCAQEMEEVQSEVETWRDCYKTAVEACYADTEVRLKISVENREKAVNNAEKLKQQLKEANKKIVFLKRHIALKDEECQKNKTEIEITKKDIDDKTTEFQEAIKQCKAQVMRSLEVCRDDAAKADAQMKEMRFQRDAAFEKCVTLSRRIDVLTREIDTLEQVELSREADKKKRLAELMSLKSELVNGREALNAQLEECRKDYNTVCSDMRSCIAEKESALADAERAKRDMVKVEKILNLLRKSAEEERAKYNQPW
eukprot:CAMPEP_0172492396 /NCGR_PEP_ID=MMETSP1066-20121228/23544_1 /TAXON_ID=671091 /ORGANISM="Coscinodiscus wailesii, Strain CCMP2513" /LENGTH=379 /DNA_ID=CAMNT_0013262011 /DNA_START=100 /DNA_END=1236 /DNA_ORIENTATION=-